MWYTLYNAPSCRAITPGRRSTEILTRITCCPCSSHYQLTIILSLCFPGKPIINSRTLQQLVEQISKHTLLYRISVHITNG